jgi:hypothetical protein
VVGDGAESPSRGGFRENPPWEAWYRRGREKGLEGGAIGGGNGNTSMEQSNGEMKN